MKTFVLVLSMAALSGCTTIPADGARAKPEPFSKGERIRSLTLEPRH